MKFKNYALPLILVAVAAAVIGCQGEDGEGSEGFTAGYGTDASTTGLTASSGGNTGTGGNGGFNAGNGGINAGTDAGSL